MSDLFENSIKRQGMRLIDADALKAKLSYKCYITYTHEYGDAIPVEWVMNAIDNAPTVEERPTGKWIFHKDYNEKCKYGCNQCGNLNNTPNNFCPNCGADMLVKNELKEAENDT